MAEDDWNLLEKMGVPKDPPEPVHTEREILGPEDEMTGVRTSEIDRLAGRWIEISTKREQLEAEEKLLVEDLARFVPEVAGDHALNTERHTIIVTRGERYLWDRDILEQMFGTDPEDLPDYVKQNLTIDKRRYLKLDEPEKDKLRPALTRKLSAPKLTVATRV